MTIHLLKIRPSLQGSLKSRNYDLINCNNLGVHPGRHTVLTVPKHHKLTYEQVPAMSTE